MNFWVLCKNLYFLNNFYRLFKDILKLSIVTIHRGAGSNVFQQNHLVRKSSVNKPFLVTEFLHSNTMAYVLVDGCVEQRNTKAAVQQNPLVFDWPHVRWRHRAARAPSGGRRTQIQNESASVRTERRVIVDSGRRGLYRLRSPGLWPRGIGLLARILFQNPASLCLFFRRKQIVRKARYRLRVVVDVLSDGVAAIQVAWFDEFRATDACLPASLQHRHVATRVSEVDALVQALHRAVLLQRQWICNKQRRTHKQSSHYQDLTVWKPRDSVVREKRVNGLIEYKAAEREI